MINSAFSIFSKKAINYRRFLLFYAFFIFGYISLSAFFLHEKENMYNYTYYFLDYELGFIKRAFLGELFDYLGLRENYTIFKIALIFKNILVMFLFVWLVAKPYVANKQKTANFLFILFAISHSLTLSSILYDFGHIEHFNFLIVFSLMLLVNSIGVYYGGLFSVFLLPIMCLVHEAAAIMFLPTFYAFFIYNSKKINNIFNYYLFFLYIIVFFISVCIAFCFGFSDYQLLVKHTSNNVGDFFTPNTNALGFLTNNIEDNIMIVLKHTFTFKRLFHHLLFAPMAILTLYVFWKINGFSRRNPKEMFLFLSCLSPLLLYLIGHDHFRWWSIAVINLFIVTSLLAAKPENNEAFTNRLFEIRHSIIALIVMSLILGSPRVYKGFLIGEQFLNFLNSLSQSSILQTIFPSLSP